MKLRLSLLSLLLIASSCQNNVPANINKPLVDNSKAMNFSINSRMLPSVPWGEVPLVPDGMGGMRCPNGNEVDLPRPPRNSSLCPPGYDDIYEVYSTTNCRGYERHVSCGRYNPDTGEFEEYDPNNNDDEDTECEKDNKTFSAKALSAEQKSNYYIQNSLFSIYQIVEKYKNDSKNIAIINTETIVDPVNHQEILNKITNSQAQYLKNVESLKLSIDNIKIQTNISSESLVFTDRMSVLINDTIQKLNNYTSYNSSYEVSSAYDVTDSLYSSLYNDLKSSIIALARQKTKIEKLNVISSNADSFVDIVNRLTNNDPNKPGFLIEQSGYNAIIKDYMSMTNDQKGNTDTVKVFNDFRSANDKIEAQKARIKRLRFKLEIAGLIDTNKNVIESDTDVKPVIDNLINYINEIEDRILLLENTYNWSDVTQGTYPTNEYRFTSDNQIQSYKSINSYINNQIPNLKNTIQLEIEEQKEENLQCAELKFKIDKKEFSPNNDNIDDTVTFSITAPKGKAWTLEALGLSTQQNTKDEYDKAVDEYLGVDNGTQEQERKIFKGVGTGESQDIIWEGKQDNDNIVSDGKYQVSLKSNSQEIKKTITKTGDIKLLFDSEMTVTPATEEQLLTSSFSTKARIPVKNNGTFTVGNGDQAILGMEVFWDTKYHVKINEFVKITGLFLLVAPNKEGKMKVIAKYPQQPFELNINALNYQNTDQNRFSYVTSWFGRDEIKGGEVYGKKGPFMSKAGNHEIIFKSLTTETNISGFKIDEKVSTKLSKFKVINNFNNYGDHAPYNVDGGSQESNLKSNAKYHIREAHDINFMNAKAFVNINAYLHDQSKYLNSLNNIVRNDPKENNPDKKGVCFKQDWSPQKIFDKIESVANMEYAFDTWSPGNPDLIQNYRYTGTKPNHTITDYSTRENHNIQVIFNNYTDTFGNKNIRIATGYPDVDATLGDGIALGYVRQHFESLMLNGSASDSVTRNQVYQNALNVFKKSLLWANDNSTGALTPLTKDIIDDYEKWASNNKILYDPQKSPTYNANKKLKRLTKKSFNEPSVLIYPSNLDSAYKILDEVNY